MDLSFFMPVKIIRGKGSVCSNAPLFREYGHKVIIVTDPVSGRLSGALDDCCDALRSASIEWEIFDKVESDPSFACIKDGVTASREAGADFVIAIGGGSSMDSGKAVALLSGQDIGEDDIVAGKYVKSALPLVCIPTTSGTGSETTPFAIITGNEKNGKINLNSPCLFAKTAFLDSRYSEKLPRTVTINTTVDAVSHAVESMITVGGNPLTRAIALTSLELAAPSFKKLPTADLDPADRESMSLAATMAGMVVGQTRTSALHGMSYPVTVKMHMPHGRAIGHLFGAYLHFTVRKNPNLVAPILRALGIPNIDVFREIVDALVGDRDSVSKDDIEAFAAEAASRRNIQNSVVQPGKDELIEIFAASFRLC